jgi:hypothetical protein
MAITAPVRSVLAGAGGSDAAAMALAARRARDGRASGPTPAYVAAVAAVHATSDRRSHRDGAPELRGHVRSAA